MHSIAISPCGLALFLTSKPDRRIIFVARSLIFTGSPMSSTNTSPPLPIAPACITNCAASGMVIKKRVISGWVKVIGPPSLICLRNNGTTEPLEPSTLPKRTIQKRVLCCLPLFCAKPCKHNSAIRLVAPITLVGRTALSVDISTKVSTLAFIAALAA